MKIQVSILSSISLFLLLTSSGCMLRMLSTQQANDQLTQGNQAMESKQFEQAIRFYNEAIRIKPDFATPYYNRGLAYFDQKQYEMALEDFEKAKQTLSDIDRLALWEILIMRGRALYLLKRYEEALADYNQALEIKPGDVGGLNNRGITYKRLKHWQKATEDLEKAISIDPQDPIPYCNLGIVKYDLEQYQEGLTLLNRSIELDPKNSLSLYSRGALYEAMNKDKLALVDLHEAIEIDHDWGEELGIWNAYHTRAVIYQKLGQHSEALKDVEQAIRLQPDHAYYLQLKGELLAELNDYNEALRAFEGSLSKIDASDSTAKTYVFYNRAKIYLKAGEYSQAIKDINQALSLSSDRQEGLNLRGQIYFQQAKYPMAILDLTEAINKGINDPYAYYDRAMSYFLTGKYAESVLDFDALEESIGGSELPSDMLESIYINRALAKNNLKDPAGALIDFGKAIEYKPDFSLAYANRSVIHMDLQNYEAVIQDLDSAFAINRNWDGMDSLSMYQNRAFARLELKRYAEAVDDYNLAIKHEPENLVLYYNRSLAFYYLSRYRQSKTDLEHVLKIDPNFPHARQNLLAVKRRM